MNGPALASSDWLDSIVELIFEDKIEDVLTAIRKRAKGSAEMTDRIVAQAGQLKRNTQAHKERTILAEAAGIERTRIATALLGIARELVATPERPISATTSEDLLAVKKQMEIGTVKSPFGEVKTSEAVLGVNNLKSLVWLEQGVLASRSVCRILVETPGGTSYGSGFLIGSGRIMTNNHVIGSIEEANNATIEFNYQLSSDASDETTARYKLDPDMFFHTDPEDKLDFTVVAVKADVKNPPLEKWGRLLLNADAVPIRRELVPIIQHPNGQPKQVALTSSVVIKATPPKLHYTTDTMGGSSGSPVFNDLWQVIAIHHAAGPTIDGVPTNEGILMAAIKPKLGNEWPKPPDPIGDYKRKVNAAWHAKWNEQETHDDFKKDAPKSE